MKNIDKPSLSKLYRGRIKPTKGLMWLGDKKTKPLSHRILRRKLKEEDMKEINSLS